MPHCTGKAMRVTVDRHNGDRDFHGAHPFIHLPALQILLENENGREEKSIRRTSRSSSMSNGASAMQGESSARCLDAKAVLMYIFKV
jgi:hypothetical protein